MRLLIILGIVWVYLSVVSVLILIYIAEHTPPADRPEIEENWER